MHPLNSSEAQQSNRNIVTTFRAANKMVVRKNRAVHANSAVLRCVDHMQHNHYGATVAEVYDLEDGTLHAVITRSVEGKITIVFKREVKA